MKTILSLIIAPIVTCLLSFGGDYVAAQPCSLPRCNAAKLSEGDHSHDADKIIDFTNVCRKRYGLQTLKPSAGLSRLAQRQADLMASRDQLSHSVDGSSFSFRLTTSGCQFGAAGENIAEGQSDSHQAVEDWMLSPGHRQNILDRNFTHIGAASKKSTSGRWYYVQIFASPASPSRHLTKTDRSVHLQHEN